MSSAGGAGSASSERAAVAGKTDVIVVGGGPAGAVTAMLLARSGIGVTLLDRARFPRAKPCGDCLSAEATRLLDRIGLLSDVLAAPHAELRGWRIYAPAGHHFAAEFSDVAYNPLNVRGAIAMERAHFDNVLINAARSAGVDVRAGEHVIDVIMRDGIVEGVTTQKRSEFRARHVVGADGLRSVIARRLGAVSSPGVRKLSLTAHVDRDLQCGDFGEMHVGDGVCAGVAPLDAGHARWNLTVVADADRFGRIAAHDARAFFISAIASLPALKRITTLLDDIGPLHASGPFDSPRRAITYPGASLVGDAAGYFDPFTGQGIYHGMRAAEMLAHALTCALGNGMSSPIVVEGYAHEARRLTRGPRRLQKAIDLVLSRPRLADRAIRRLAHAPAAAQAILEVTGDMAPVRSLFSTHVARSLILPESS